MKVRLLTVYSTYANDSEMPQIRIQGKWLEKLGFTPGKKFIIQEKSGELTLKSISIEE